MSRRAGRSEIAGWRRDPVAMFAPGGESLIDVDRRVRGALIGVIERLQRAADAPVDATAGTGVDPAPTGRAAASFYDPHAGPWIVLVGHDGAFKVALLALLGLPLDRFWTFTQTTTGIAVVDIRNGRSGPSRLESHGAPRAARARGGRGGAARRGGGRRASAERGALAAPAPATDEGEAKKRDPQASLRLAERREPIRAQATSTVRRLHGGAGDELQLGTHAWHDIRERPEVLVDGLGRPAGVPEATGQPGDHAVDGGRLDRPAETPPQQDEAEPEQGTSQRDGHHDDRTDAGRPKARRYAAGGPAGLVDADSTRGLRRRARSRRWPTGTGALTTGPAGSASGRPTPPPVGSKSTQPAPGNHASTQACAWSRRIVSRPLASRTPGRNPSTNRAGIPSTRSIITIAEA